MSVAPEVEHRARLVLLDTLGCMLGGRSAPEVAAFESEFSSVESGNFSFPGGRRLSVLGATAVGAMAADWDGAAEEFPPSHASPAVPVAAALLPQGLARDVNLQLLLDSLIAGYEVGAQAASARFSWDGRVDRHWPSLGVAAGLAHLLKLPAGMRAAALDFAAESPLPASDGVDEQGPSSPRRAWLGALAALSAAAGLQRPSQASVAHELDDTRASSLILQSHLKSHAASLPVHFGAEAARGVRDLIEGRTAAISGIRLRVDAWAMERCGHRSPERPALAQSSLSFGVAAALRWGGIEAGVYRNERFHDAELRRLEQLVIIEASRESRGATLAVMADDECHDFSVDTIPGAPEQPMSDEEVAAKFLRQAAASVPAEKAYNFASVLLCGESQTPLRSIWDLLF